MAVRAAKVEEVNSNRVAKITWSGLLTGDTGAWVDLGRWADKTVGVVGVFSTAAAGVVTMQGSQDGGTTPGSLHNPQGDLLAISEGGTENDLLLIAESPERIRPIVSGGDGGTDLTVTITAPIRGV